MGIQHQHPDYRVDQSTLFCNADAQNGNQYYPQGSKTSKVIHHFKQDTVDPIMGEQVYRPDNLIGPRMNYLPSHGRTNR